MGGYLSIPFSYRQDYIDMKAKEKFQGVDFQHSNDKKRRNNFMIQYEGAGDMGFRDIRVSRDDLFFSNQAL